MMFLVDLRGLNHHQRHIIWDCLHESNDFAVVSEEADFIKIELSDPSCAAKRLLYGDVRKHLADLLNSWCQHHPDLFLPNSNYAWWTRTLLSLGT
jgi:hypothetical protein